MTNRWLKFTKTTRPDEVAAAVRAVRRKLSSTVGIHAHNDGELAVANSLTAVEMGAALVGETQRASRSRDAAAERGADTSPAAGLIWQDCGTDSLGRDCRMRRSKVPGGWLVLFLQWSQGMQQPSLTFYPDPQHVWDGTSID